MTVRTDAAMTDTMPIASPLPSTERGPAPPAADLVPELASVDLAPLLRPIVFAEPDRLMPPPAWAGHLPFAFWLVDVLRPRVLVELGVHTGNSYCGFCQAVRTLALPTQCYGVDTWRGDPQAGFYGEEVLADLKAWHEPRYAGFSRLIRSTFDEALAHFPDGSIDLLHIDGFHTYEAVAHDFTSWQPKLSSRAIVLFHDINVRERDFGVWRLWQEVSAGRPHFAFLNSNGLGVLAAGQVDSAPLDWLFSAHGQEAAAIRGLLARLGNVLETRLALAEGDGLILSTATDAGERHQIVAARDALALERDGLADQVRTQQGEIDALVAEVVARDRRLAAAQEELRAAEARQAAALQAMQAQADTYVSSQNETVERLHRLAAEAAAQRDATGRELEALRADLQTVYASTSWHLTAPLRALGRLFRRG